MREIRFRAWYPEEKKMWVDVETDGNGAIILNTENMGLKPLDGEAILMLYTGLSDRNGKPIFEGDIVASWTDKIPRLIKWGGACWLMENISDKYQDIPSQPILKMRKYEVIGNIYENPELLT